jgi:hypothetical protein
MDVLVRRRTTGLSTQKLRSKYVNGCYKIDAGDSTRLEWHVPYRLLFPHATQHALTAVFGDLRARGSERRDLKNRHCRSVMTLYVRAIKFVTWRRW